MAKILVADDSAFARLNCKKVLTKGGHDVVEDADGIQAVALYHSERPGVVFLDVTMPGMDGLAALGEIIKFDAQARIAMASAMGQQSVVIEALKAGAKDFLVKPFEPARVLTTLDKLLA